MNESRECSSDFWRSGCPHGSADSVAVSVDWAPPPGWEGTVPSKGRVFFVRRGGIPIAVWAETGEDRRSGWIAMAFFQKGCAHGAWIEEGWKYFWSASIWKEGIVWRIDESNEESKEPDDCCYPILDSIFREQGFAELVCLEAGRGIEAGVVPCRLTGAP